MPEGANFCWNCGQPQKAGMQSSRPTEATSGQWETCEIVHQARPDEIVPSIQAHITFAATAVSPTGNYIAAKSSSFTINPAFSNKDLSPKPDDANAKRAVDELRAKLVGMEWQEIGEGKNWFNFQYRRRLKPNLG